MRISNWDSTPISEIQYRYAQRGGSVVALGNLAITSATASGLPDDLEGLVLTADLQGREMLPPTRRASTAPTRLYREGRRLLGEVVADHLATLCDGGRLPPAN